MGTFGATQTIQAGGSAIAHTNLQATAASATVLLAPLTYSGSDARVVLLHPDVDRFVVRSRGIYDTHTTSPIINGYLLYYRDGNVDRIQPGDTNIPDDGTILTRRIEVGITSYVITLNTTVATTEKDSTYKYSPIYGSHFSNTRIGYLAAQQTCAFIYRDSAFGILFHVHTQGNVSGLSDTCEAQVLAYGVQ